VSDDILERSDPPPDQEVRYGDLPDQVIDVWFGDDGAGDLPLVVLIHGGFWRPAYDRLHLRPMASALRSDGWAVASIEYRREPGNPSSTLDDVTAAFRAIPKGLIYDGSVLLSGHSAGGHLALWSAATGVVPGLRATLALAPVADLALAERTHVGSDAVTDFLGRPLADHDGIDPAQLDAPETPVVILHGTADPYVPPALSESYAERHPQTKVVPIDGADHFDLVDPASEAWPTVTAEFRRLSAAPA
jgi:acetyl esterase/lipase